MSKVLFVLGINNSIFIDNYIAFLQKNAYEVKTILFTHRTEVDRDVAWPNIIFCEWCCENAVWYSKHKKQNQKLIVRIHRFELMSEYIHKVTWKNVDQVITISPYICGLFAYTKATCIFNYIKFPIENTKKTNDANYNIAMIGFVPELKRPDIAVNLIIMLKNIDPKYKLFLIGKQPLDVPKYYVDLYKMIYKNNLENNVFFEKYTNDIHKWLEKIRYVLSCSDIEGSHHAVAEGMGSGCIPLITGGFLDHGAKTIYPNKFCFDNLDSIVNQIVTYNDNEENLSKDVEFCVSYAKQHFDAAIIYDKITKLLS